MDLRSWSPKNAGYECVAAEIMRVRDRDLQSEGDLKGTKGVQVRYGESNWNGLRRNSR